MTFYSYSLDKNLKLIQVRNISFEDIISTIENNQILDILQYPHPEKYKSQKNYVIHANDYIYLVPFVTDDQGNIFLKTIIPSQKAKQKYLGEIL